MKKTRMAKIIAVSLLLISGVFLKPSVANAEWKSDTFGWWYTDGDSCYKGWKLLDGNWYFFYNSGYMAHDTKVDGYYLNSSGAWSESMPNIADKSDFKLIKQSDQINWLEDYNGQSENIIVPASIDGINITGAEFDKNNVVKNVILSDGIKIITTFGFSSCESLESVSIPNSVIQIDGGAFSGCENLRDVILPKSIKYLMWNVFSNCTNLRSVVMPENIKTIYTNAFYNCVNLRDVYIETESLRISFDTPLGTTSNTPFIGCDKAVFHVKNDEVKNELMKKAHIGADRIFVNGVMDSLVIENSTVNIKDLNNIDEDGIEFNTNTGTIFRYKGHNENVQIPSKIGGFDVKTIGEYAFSVSFNIKTITISESITKIEKNAFAMCDELIYYVSSERVNKLLVDSGVDKNKIIIKK